ncbi:MAG: protein kinase domain-containing protein [Prochlorothrix sp.]
MPFWKVLDSEAWTVELDQGRFFENKIVLIGGTALRLQDFHPTPFSESLRYPSTMAGVEIQATAIATLAQDNFLYPLIPRRDLQAVLVLALVAALSSGLGTLSQARSRLLLTIGNGGLWLLLGYGLQTSGQWLIPVAVPVAGLLTIGGGCVVLAILRDYYRHQRLETAIRENDDLPSVEELLSFVKPTAAELQAQTQLVAGKMIGQRYEVVQVLGMGGFSETFTAQDKQRPGQPICVVKQLKTHNQDPTVVHLVRRSFKIEAEMLERLGSHSQIPRLLAYFEEGEEFFLIQEYVEGISLLSEFVTQRYFTPATVMTMLADLLPVLAFVHAQQVIHRDIKPSNIIRNTTNGRLYLIDFGIAKAMTAQLLAARQDNPITVGLGTQGYMPREQAAGHPVFSSDLYALGVMAIQALTGFNPQQLGRDHQGELDWQDADLGLSAEFEHWLTQMVHQDYDQRFASAQVALDHLIQVPEFNSVAAETRSAIARQGVVEYSLANLPTPHEAISVDWNETARDEEGATQPWPQDWQDPASASDPSPASPSPEDTRPWPQDWQDPVTQLDRSNPAPQANPAAGDDALEPPTIVEASPPVIEIEPPTLSASRPIPEEDGPS